MREGAEVKLSISCGAAPWLAVLSVGMGVLGIICTRLCQPSYQILEWDSRNWGVPSGGFYCCDETLWPKSKLGSKGLFDFIHHQRSQDRNSNRLRTWRQELMQRSWRGGAYWLATCGLLGQLSCNILKATSPGMAPPKWAGSFLINHCNFMEILFKLRFPPLNWF